MTTDPSNGAEREQRWSEVLVACLEDVEAGHHLDRQTLLARYPEFAAELEEFLLHREQVDRLTAPLRTFVQATRDATPHPGDNLLLEPQKQDGSVSLTGTASFGDYELLQQLGQGGMGIVYKARHRRLQRLVALKMISVRGLMSESDVQRLRNEAETVAHLDHPHIVPIYEVGEQDGRPYFSMKLIEGGGLDKHLTRFQADPRASARLLATIARAVHHAHQRGILHRDLKPSNILLASRGPEPPDDSQESGGSRPPLADLIPHITDFGLAKRLDGDSSLTLSGALVGTPSYMAPEQASGMKGTVTTATDVYGLGAILYTLLTGKPPFRGETPLDTLGQVKERAPEPLRRTNPRVDRDLETICLKCLEKEPQQRYGSAQALAEDLDRWLAGRPIQARAAGRTEQLWRWCRRNRALASAITLAASGLLAVAVIATVFAFREKSHAEVLGQEKKQTEQALEQARTHRRLAESYTQHAFDMIGADTEAWHVQNPAEVRTVAEFQRTTAQAALLFFQDFIKREKDDPESRYLSSLAYRSLAHLHELQGNTAQAQVCTNKADEILERLVADFPEDPGYKGSLGRIYSGLGNVAYYEGRFELAREKFAQAAALYDEVLELNPDARSMDLVASLRALCPCEEFRDLNVALPLAKKVVLSEPKSDMAWNLLGIVHYRLGNYEEALKAVDKSGQVHGRKGSWTLFCEAMIHQQMGHIDQARLCYRQAQDPLVKGASFDPTLETFGEEAAAVLGLPKAVKRKAAGR